MQTSDTLRSMNSFRVRELLGNRVRNAQNEDLGTIEDIVIDADSGRISYAVLSFGGFLGLGDKLFAIPWQALSMSSHEGSLGGRDYTFILNVDKDRLRNAPGFEKNHWPSTADRGYASDVYNYYGYRPYW